MDKLHSKRKKIWILRGDFNELQISGDWGGPDSNKDFSDIEAKAIFECIKEAIESKFNVVVNPWSDAEPGTLD